MYRARIGRGAAIIAATLVAIQLLAAPAAAAPPAGWDMDVDRLPVVVANGADAGFQITITNNGPSNISQLYLFDSPTAGPTFVDTSQGTCTAVGVDLRCSFGALNDDQSLTVIVAYTTPVSGNSFVYTAFANTTGVADDDDNSHGDALEDSATTTLNSNRNFGGGFHVGTGTVTNDTSLHPKKNKQSTQLFGVASNVVATVEDGPGITETCTGCSPILPEWSHLVVDNGNPLDEPVKVVLTATGSYNNLDLSTAILYHVLDTGAVQLIGNVPAERCDSPTSPSFVPGEGCVIFSLVGNNLRAIAFIWQNGKMR